MLIWSILTQKAWKKLQREGRLRTSRRHVMKEFLGPYLWMVEQMEKRLKTPRPGRDAMPIWAWRQWEGVKRCKPDLRSGGHLPQGFRGVRVECRVDDRRVLLSDFDLWHYVLNYWYLPTSERDGNAFEKKLAGVGLSFYKFNYSNSLPNVQYRREIERSWDRIFDVKWTDQSRAIANIPKKKSIQATLWEICLEDVVEAKEFMAR
jgi:hypothetical protein